MCSSLPKSLDNSLIQKTYNKFDDNHASESKDHIDPQMERFVIITIITKHSILDVTAALDPPLVPWRLKVH